MSRFTAETAGRQPLSYRQRTPGVCGMKLLHVWLLLLLSMLQESPAQDVVPQPRPRNVPASTETLPPAVAPLQGPLPSEVSPDSVLGTIPRKIYYLINDRGEFVPVPVDATLDNFLNWLDQRDSSRPVLRPEVAVSSVELTGVVEEQFANLKARIRLKVSGSKQPVLFAIGMGEAVILDSQFSGPQVPVYEGKDPEKGYRWWLDGDGNYEFQLQVLLPIRRVAPWRRVQLSLPMTPVSTLQLQVPEAAPVIKSPEDVIVETRILDEKSSEIRVSGFGNRLDLQWQPTTGTADQRTALDVNTTVLVQGTPQAFLVEATQYVKPLQGVLKEFHVQLPERSELLQVEGAEIRETRADPAKPGRVTVELLNPTAGTVVLKWNVRLPRLPDQRTILNGFSVESARRQTGEIGLVAPDAARWTISDTADTHLERMNAGELRLATGSGNVVRAYRFFDQPFKLLLDLQSIEPFFDVRPLLVVYAGRDEVRLEGRYDIRTFRGRLSELSLIWPGWRAAGWKLEPVQPAGTVVTNYNPDDATDSGRIAIGISDQAPSNFELRLTAWCATPRGSDGKITLPRLIGSSTASARVAFLHAEDVDADLTPSGETVLYPVAADESLTAESLGYPPGLKLKLFRLETEERQLALRVTPQPLRVSVNSLTRVELTQRKLAVTQQLRHQIDYQRQQQLQFQVPASIARSVRFLYQGQELLPEWSDAERPRERMARIRLPQAALGEVDLLATWEQSLPAELWTDKDTGVGISLVQSRMGPVVKNTLEFVRPAWFSISVVDNAWTLEHEDDNLARWTAGPAVMEFNGLVSPTSGSEGEQFLVGRAAVHVSADRDGLQACVIQMRLAGAGTHLNVLLPATAISSRFFWNGREIPQTEVLEFPEGSRRFTLPWPTAEDVSAEHLLRIEYSNPAPPVTGMSARFESHVPRLPQCRWATRVIWFVDVPADQHLFTPPTSASPLYEWRREGLIWRRESIVSQEDVQRWLSAEEVIPVSDVARLNHRYAFSQIGPLENVQLRLLSTATAFLLGTGSALLLGFFVIKFAALRSIFSALGAIGLAMIAALWYLPQLELLLQPLVFGAFISMLLGLQEFWKRRRAAGTILTLAASPSEFRTPGEMTATHSLQIRTQDSATIFREPPADDSHSRSAVESHVG